MQRPRFDTLRAVTRFRPCIDLYGGRVVQIVGSTLRDDRDPETHYVSDRDADWFAARYREDDLGGGHLIKLGPENDAAARLGLAAWPGGLQVGGGINSQNAAAWLDSGATSRSRRVQAAPPM